MTVLCFVLCFLGVADARDLISACPFPCLKGSGKTLAYLLPVATALYARLYAKSGACRGAHQSSMIGKIFFSAHHTSLSCCAFAPVPARINPHTDPPSGTTMSEYVFLSVSAFALSVCPFPYPCVRPGAHSRGGREPGRCCPGAIVLVPNRELGLQARCVVPSCCAFLLCFL